MAATAWPRKKTSMRAFAVQQAIGKPSKPSWPIASVSWSPVKRPSPMPPREIFPAQRFDGDGCITREEGWAAMRSSMPSDTRHDGRLAPEGRRVGLGATLAVSRPLPSS